MGVCFPSLGECLRCTAPQMDERDVARVRGVLRAANEAKHCWDQSAMRTEAGEKSEVVVAVSDDKGRDEKGAAPGGRAAVRTVRAKTRIKKVFCSRGRRWEEGSSDDEDP
mmetsp:Transcript_102353/g.305658  ORF Transcript_102353/g.305658 Transcript_102353/m.305658 type:complete len:110 (-) Transcript_102353:249-578(-)